MPKSIWMSRGVSVVSCTMPAIAFLYVLGFWLIASAVLGQWARPHVDDPKQFLAGIPAVVGTILILLSIAVVPVVVIVGYRRGRLGAHLLAYSASLLAATLLFRSNVLQLSDWFAD